MNHEARKSFRINNEATNSLNAIVHFIIHFRDLGYRLILSDALLAAQLTPQPTADIHTILGAVYDLEDAQFLIVTKDGQLTRMWARFMWPSPITCGERDSVVDFGANVLTDAWAREWHRKCAEFDGLEAVDRAMNHFPAVQRRKDD